MLRDAILAALAIHDPNCERQGTALRALGTHFGEATDAEVDACSFDNVTEYCDPPLVARADYGFWVLSWRWAKYGETAPPPYLPAIGTAWTLTAPLGTLGHIGTDAKDGEFQDEEFIAPAGTVWTVTGTRWLNDEWNVSLACNDLPGRAGYTMTTEPSLDNFSEDFEAVT